MQKGIVLHICAKIVVIFSSCLLHFFIGRFMSIEEYGIIGIVITLCNFYYMFLTDGAKQSISKNISSHKFDPMDVIKKSVVIQIALGISIGVLNYLLAHQIAVLYNDPSLEKYFKAVSFLIPLTGLFFALTGVLNGIKFFLGETILLMLYPILRLSGVIIIQYMDESKPLDVICGFILSSFICVIAAIIIIARKKKRIVSEATNVIKISYKETLQGVGSFIAFFAGIIAVLNMGVFILRALTQDKVITGYYTAVYNFALLPYYAISAFFLVLLPYVSDNYAKGKIEEIKQMIMKFLHLVFLLVLPIAILVCCSAESLLTSFYNEEYIPATLSMQIQIIGVLLLSVSVLLNMALSGMGEQKTVTIITLITVIVDVLLHFVLINSIGMVGASVATLIVSIFAFIASYLSLWRKIGAFINVKSFLKPTILITIVTIIAAVLFSLVSVHNLLLLIAIYCALGVLYLALGVSMKIIDIKSLKRGQNE